MHRQLFTVSASSAWNAALATLDRAKKSQMGVGKLYACNQRSCHLYCLSLISPSVVLSRILLLCSFSTYKLFIPCGNIWCTNALARSPPSGSVFFDLKIMWRQVAWFQGPAPKLLLG